MNRHATFILSIRYNLCANNAPIYIPQLTTNHLYSQIFWRIWKCTTDMHKEILFPLCFLVLWTCKDILLWEKCIGVIIRSKPQDLPCVWLVQNLNAIRKFLWQTAQHSTSQGSGTASWHSCHSVSFTIGSVSFRKSIFLDLSPSPTKQGGWKPLQSVSELISATHSSSWALSLL